MRLHTQLGLLSYSKFGITISSILFSFDNKTGVKVTSLIGFVVSLTVLLWVSRILTKGDNLPLWRKAVWFTVCLIPFTELFFFTGILSRLRDSSRLGKKLYSIFYSLKDDNLLLKENYENADYNSSNDDDDTTYS